MRPLHLGAPCSFHNYDRMFFDRSSQSNLLNRIFSDGSSTTNLLSWIFSSQSSQLDILRLIFSVGSFLIDLPRPSLTDLFRRPYSSPTTLNPITSTSSWNTSGVALSSASDRVKYIFITSLVHMTYMLQLKGEC